MRFAEHYHDNVDPPNGNVRNGCGAAHAVR